MTKMILMTSMIMVMVTVKIGTSGVVVDHVVVLDAINSLQRGHLEQEQVGCYFVEKILLTGNLMNFDMEISVHFRDELNQSI